MPQLPDSLDPKGLKGDREVEIEWRTISYRTVWTIVLLVVALILLGVYIKYRESINPVITKVLSGEKPAGGTAFEQRQARFLNMEGTIRVKKANAVAWVSASPNLPLEKGDVIATSSDGICKISFADGTVYSMKSDTLVVVEENSGSASSKATNVSVKVTSGEVDLATTKFEGESKVTFANAVARIGQDTRASVKNDPTSRQASMTVRQGQAAVSRGGETTTLGAYEQASFQGETGKLVHQRVSGPPLLLMPPDKMPVLAAEGEKPVVTFSWTNVPTAASYRLLISTSPIFATLAYNKRVSSVSVPVSSLPEGTYYWAVSSIDEHGKESQPSDASKFTLLNKAKDEILLQLDSVVQHGNQLEIAGRTEPGARVMVNDQPVFTVQPDGSFKHFTPPLARGTNPITVTALNAKGQIATKRKTVYIQ
jgi:hypothetical protein